MMKHLISALYPVLIFLLFASCSQMNASLSDLITHTKAAAAGAGGGGVPPTSDPTVPDNSQPIPIDTANRMIGSYLESIDYTINTEAIRSWAFNADTLRSYLSKGNGKSIVMLKFMLAHTLDYINAGNYGVKLPANSHALTIIIVGIDSTGNEVYNTQMMAYDQCQPCPDDCVGHALLKKQ
jgi:hypothetical protein